MKDQVSPAGSRFLSKSALWFAISPSSTKAAGFKCYLAARPTAQAQQPAVKKTPPPSKPADPEACFGQCRQNRKCCYPADESYRHTEPSWHLAFAFSLNLNHAADRLRPAVSATLRPVAAHPEIGDDFGLASPQMKLSASLNCAPRKNQKTGADEPSNEIAKPPTERDAKKSQQEIG